VGETTTGFNFPVERRLSRTRGFYGSVSHYIIYPHITIHFYSQEYSPYLYPFLQYKWATTWIYIHYKKLLLQKTREDKHSDWPVFSLFVLFYFKNLKDWQFRRKANTSASMIQLRAEYDFINFHISFAYIFH